MNALTITRLDRARAADLLPSLAVLLQDAVDGGASVGFLPPLSTAEAEAYWRSLLPEVEQGTRLMFAACAGDQVLGSVQLGLAQRPNSRHRAEVQKLLVLTRARRQGLATRLMRTAEAAACSCSIPCWATRPSSCTWASATSPPASSPTTPPSAMAPSSPPISSIASLGRVNVTAPPLTVDPG